ncbi:hypothetical protein [Chamaesiphon minutus]|uniref:hypothetical protein n=1 Tax=Chamaesiphon minutus TaxID=1173032 RepID=UPI003BEF03A6
MAIIDLDAHEGNGIARISNRERTFHILVMYNRDIYPQDRQAIASIVISPLHREREMLNI